MCTYNKIYRLTLMLGAMHIYREIECKVEMSEFKLIELSFHSTACYV